MGIARGVAMPRNEKSDIVPCTHVLITAIELLADELKDGGGLALIYSPAELREQREECLAQRQRNYEALGLEAPPFDFSS
jgi:hypothetical protein